MPAANGKTPSRTALAPPNFNTRKGMIQAARMLPETLSNNLDGPTINPIG